MRKPPPKRKKGQAQGPRTIDGEILDVSGLASFLGTSEKMIRARVDRGLLPFHRWSGRLIFVRSEVMDYMRGLPGCSVEEATENEAMRRGDVDG